MTMAAARSRGVHKIVVSAMTTAQTGKHNVATTTTSAARGNPAQRVSRRLALWLSGALLLITDIASGLTFFGDGILTGPAVMNGSARGTALVLLCVVTPVMAVAMALAVRGSVRSIVVWLGALAAVIYNAQMYLYATPFNQLFLLYVAMLALAVWSTIALLAYGTVALIAERTSPAMPVRAIAGYVWLIAALNTLLWLRTIIPAILSDTPGSILDGTGLTTNPVFVQDLALWLPLAAIGAVWLWGRRPWGYTVIGGLLAFWVLESITVGVDQWFGSQADPASTIVSASMTPAFGALALIGLVPLWLFMKGWVHR